MLFWRNFTQALSCVELIKKSFRVWNVKVTWVWIESEGVKIETCISRTRFGSYFTRQIICHKSNWAIKAISGSSIATSGWDVETHVDGHLVKLWIV